MVCKADPRSLLALLNFSKKRSGVYPVKPVRFLFNWDEFNRGTQNAEPLAIKEKAL